jgi:hypothetical protein
LTGCAHEIARDFKIAMENTPGLPGCSPQTGQIGDKFLTKTVFFLISIFFLAFFLKEAI